jgi:hypothetical protein
MPGRGRMKPPALLAAGYADFVEHPRFGVGPRITGLDVADSYDGKVYCHWHSPPGVRVPNTAVVADVTRQQPATLHVTHYFDATRVCRTCGCSFLFFAEEQKHWYEDLGFPLEADCLDCVRCRKALHRVRASRQTYEALLEQTDRTDADTLELVECALFLIEAAAFSTKLVPSLRGLLKPLLTDVDGPSYARAKALSTRLYTSTPDLR